MIISPLAFLLSDFNNIARANIYENIFALKEERGIVVESEFLTDRNYDRNIVLEFYFISTIFLFILGTDNILEQMLFECVFSTRIERQIGLNGLAVFKNYLVFKR